MKGFPVHEAGQMLHSILLPGSPCNDAWRHQEKSQEPRTYTRWQVSGSLGRPGQKCLLSASQPQPAPLAAGIHYSILERFPFPSAHLIRLMLWPHTAGQSLSQDISLFPGNAITSLFLPVLRHAVLASVCSWKCQVRSL